MLLGNLLVFGAVLCEAFYAVIGKKLTGKLSATRISALINLWGLALVAPLGRTLVQRTTLYGRVVHPDGHGPVLASIG